jgi:hypothetical protein
VLRGPVEIVQVLLGQRADGQIAAREVQSLPRSQAAGQRYFHARAPRRDIGHDHGDRAIGEQNGLAGLEIVRQRPVRAGDFPRGRRRVGDQRELVVQTTVQNIAAEWVESHLRAAQILQHGDVTLHVATERSDVGENGAVFLVRAVREVEPEHADACRDELT